MSAAPDSSDSRKESEENQKFLRLFVEKLKRYCHVKGYSLGSIPERYMWNCSYSSQRADDECAHVDITFTFDTSGGFFMGNADITRVFFVGGGYDFEWRANYKSDLDETELTNFFANVDAYVEVSFERLRDNDFITFVYEKDKYEDFDDGAMIKLLDSLRQNHWKLEWKIFHQTKFSVTYEAEGVFSFNLSTCNDTTHGRIYIKNGDRGFEVHGNFQRKIYGHGGGPPSIVFDLIIKRQIIKSRGRMTKYIKGYLYQLIKLKTGDIEETRRKVKRKYENFEKIIQSVHAPQQHESEGDKGGEGGKGGTASQMTTVASILETIHERVSKLEVIH